MRLFVHLVTGITAMAFLFWSSASGQYFEDPTLYFKKFEFDMMNRGSFNISMCLTDLMTCFELVKADVICSFDRLFESVCPLTREVCHDYYGNYDTYSFRFTSKEHWCERNQERS